MKTGLYEKHCDLGAKIVTFGGWEMPLQYQGIIHEHQVVREKVGIFDVSHMGRVVVEGPDAGKFLDYLSTNQISGKKEGTATYTVWCTESGGSVDDLMVYKEREDRYFVVVNAGNRDKDLAHLKQASQGFNVTIEDRFNDGILAIQGPLAASVMAKIFPDAAQMKPMRWSYFPFEGEQVIVSTTGYTGAGGYELYAPTLQIVSLWDQFLQLGKEEGIEPIGLGARDTLRLEMGYALYGHELTEEIAPIESVSAWTVKWKKENFLGKAALERLEESSKKRFQYGVVLLDKGIAREGYSVYKDETQIGAVTSGTMSPSLKKAIALVLVDYKLNIGDSVDIMIRDKRCRGEVTQLPFYRA